MTGGGPIKVRVIEDGSHTGHRLGLIECTVPAGPAPTTSTSQAVRSPMSVYPNETSAEGPVSRTLSMSAIDLPPRGVGDVPFTT